MSKYEEVRERIARFVCEDPCENSCIESIHIGYCKGTLLIADQILADPDLLIRAEDQSLPPKPKFVNDWGGECGLEGYIYGQEHLILAGWRKVIST